MLTNSTLSASIKAPSPYILLENILDTAIVINDKGIVQYFNKQAETFFGYNRFVCILINDQTAN